jgi:phospholipid-binding lipoprotein MlaA
MPRSPLFLLVLASLAFTGCASLPPGHEPDPRDPYERLNRTTWAVNQNLDKAIARPIARGYRRAVPGFAQTGVRNFMRNARQPTVIVNTLLQGRLRDAGSSTGRFLLNSTLGLGGLLDPASDAGLDQPTADFGQTLGRWGVGPGPYVMAPVFGPYTVRDGFGSLVDAFNVDVRSFIDDDAWRYGLWALGLLDDRVQLLDADAVIDRAFDPYVLVRSVYLQRRQYLVTGEAEALEDEWSDEELEAAELEAAEDEAGE